VIVQVCDEHPEASVRQLCPILRVNRAWYYQRLKQGPPSAPDLALRDAIERLVLEFPGYGYRRVTAALQRAGWIVNHKRVLRIMREESLLCQLKRGFIRTTDSNHGLRVYPNRLASCVLRAPDEAWVGDITYVRLPTSFVYLAALLDAYSRCCVGWQLSRTIDTQLALDALEMALTRRQVKPGWIHHSDRGVQYASHDYITRLASVGAQVSMSAKGNPYDNAKAESFFKTLKTEEVYLNQYQTFQDAEANIGIFIEDVYNAKRLHSSLGYLSPLEFEAVYAQTPAS
jgi:putative transposase